MVVPTLDEKLKPPEESTHSVELRANNPEVNHRLFFSFIVLLLIVSSHVIYLSLKPFIPLFPLGINLNLFFCIESLDSFAKMSLKKIKHCLSHPFTSNHFEVLQSVVFIIIFLHVQQWPFTVRAPLRVSHIMTQNVVHLIKSSPVASCALWEVLPIFRL